MIFSILNSACVAALYEGLASNFETARGMIRSGEVELRPAQDFDVVIPLAAVVSASMPLHSVYDAWKGRIRCFAPINGGIGPSLRLGLLSEDVLAHVRWLNTRVKDALQEGIAEGIALVPLAAKGLREGDDCHGRTPVSGAALIEEIEMRSKRGIRDEQVAEFVQASPSLFLNLWMAATKTMMKAAEGVDGSGVITAAGGNGREFGIQISSDPGRWYTAAAKPPEGDIGEHSPDMALGAIGDSAVVDCLGLGAMSSIDLRDGPAGDELGSFLVGYHPNFLPGPRHLGCTVFGGDPLFDGPAVSLGILDKEGARGRLGGGIFSVPASLRKAALIGAGLN